MREQNIINHSKEMEQERSDPSFNGFLYDINKEKSPGVRVSDHFYKNLILRENTEYFDNLDTTFRSNAKKIAQLFKLTEMEENILVEIAILQLGEGFTPENSNQNSLSFSRALPLLAPDAPLRINSLIEVTQSNQFPSEFKIHDRIMNALFGIRSIDSRLLELITKSSPHMELSSSRRGFADKISGIIKNKKTNHGQESKPSGLILEIIGNDSADMLAIAEMSLRESGHDPYILRLQSILYHPEHETSFIQLWNRDSCIDPLAAIINLTGEETPDRYTRIVEFVSALSSPVVILSTGNRKSYTQNSLIFSIPELEHKDQDELWGNALISTDDRLHPYVDSITNNFLLKPADITRIAAFALASDPHAESIESVGKELWQEAKRASRPSILDLATLIEPVTTLQDLAIPAATQELLREIIDRVKNNRRVLDKWGFKNKFKRGLGITALFYGKSGTGKTHAAEAITGELDLDLYHIDLSRVISKYIGETEKNLGRICDGAKNSGAVLLFDEADALFGKRSEVADAHDRYANQEVSYLLQKMEEYPGLSILTTNLANNLDEAFNRRINYRLVFPMTNAETRQSIWERIFPKETPTQNLNYTELAGELELTGAEIKNLALRAAYVASSADEPVKMKHIRKVLKDELKKDGIIINDGDLNHWNRDE